MHVPIYKDVQNNLSTANWSNKRDNTSQVGEDV